MKTNANVRKKEAAVNVRHQLHFNTLKCNCLLLTSYGEFKWNRRPLKKEHSAGV